MAVLTGARLLVLDNKGACVREVPIRTNQVKFGSNPLNTIRLRSKLSERLHCKIFAKNEKVYIANYSAEQPIARNGVIVTEQTILVHGDIIEICGIRFRWHFDDTKLHNRTKKLKKNGVTPTSSKHPKRRRTTINIKQRSSRDAVASSSSSGAKRTSTKSTKPSTYTLPKNRKELIKNMRKRFTVHSIVMPSQSDEESVVEEYTEESTPVKLEQSKISNVTTPYYTPDIDKENVTPISMSKGRKTPMLQLENSAMMILSYTPGIGRRSRVNTPKTPLNSTKRAAFRSRLSNLTPKNENIPTTVASAKSVSQAGHSMFLIDLTSPNPEHDSFICSPNLDKTPSTPGLIDLITPSPKKGRTPSSALAKSNQKVLLKSALKNARSALRDPVTPRTPVSWTSGNSKLQLKDTPHATQNTPIGDKEGLARAVKRKIPTSSAGTPISEQSAYEDFVSTNSRLLTPKLGTLGQNTPTPKLPLTLKRRTRSSSIANLPSVQIVQEDISSNTDQSEHRVSEFDSLSRLAPSSEAIMTDDDAPSPVITSDDLFDTLVGKNSIKKTYARKTGSPRTPKSALVISEGGSDLPKSDIDLWVESVTAATPDPESLSVETVMKKPNRTTQVRSSKYSDITPHDSVADIDQIVPANQNDDNGQLKDSNKTVSLENELENLSDKPNIANTDRHSVGLTRKIVRTLDTKRQTIGNFFTNMFGKLTVSPVTRVSISDESAMQQQEEENANYADEYCKMNYSSDNSGEIYYDIENDKSVTAVQPTVSASDSPKLRQSLRNTRKFIGSALISLNTSKPLENTAEIDESMLLNETCDDNLGYSVDDNYDLTDLSSPPAPSQSTSNVSDYVAQSSTPIVKQQKSVHRSSLLRSKSPAKIKSPSTSTANVTSRRVTSQHGTSLADESKTGDLSEIHSSLKNCTLKQNDSENSKTELGDVVNLEPSTVEDSIADEELDVSENISTDSFETSVSHLAPMFDEPTAIQVPLTSAADTDDANTNDQGISFKEDTSEDVDIVLNTDVVNELHVTDNNQRFSEVTKNITLSDTKAENKKMSKRDSVRLKIRSSLKHPDNTVVEPPSSFGWEESLNNISVASNRNISCRSTLNKEVNKEVNESRLFTDVKKDCETTENAIDATIASNADSLDGTQDEKSPSSKLESTRCTRRTLSKLLLETSSGANVSQHSREEKGELNTTTAPLAQSDNDEQKVNHNDKISVENRSVTGNDTLTSLEKLDESTANRDIQAAPKNGSETPLRRSARYTKLVVDDDSLFNSNTKELQSQSRRSMSSAKDNSFKSTSTPKRRTISKTPSESLSLRKSIATKQLRVAKQLALDMSYSFGDIFSTPTQNKPSFRVQKDNNISHGSATRTRLSRASLRTSEGTLPDQSGQFLNSTEIESQEVQTSCVSNCSSIITEQHENKVYLNSSYIQKDKSDKPCPDRSENSSLNSILLNTSAESNIASEYSYNNDALSTVNGISPQSTVQRESVSDTPSRGSLASRKSIAESTLVTAKQLEQFTRQTPTNKTYPHQSDSFDSDMIRHMFITPEKEQEMTPDTREGILHTSPTATKPSTMHLNESTLITPDTKKTNSSITETSMHKFSPENTSFVTSVKPQILRSSKRLTKTSLAAENRMMESLDTSIISVETTNTEKSMQKDKCNFSEKILQENQLTSNLSNIMDSEMTPSIEHGIIHSNATGTGKELSELNDTQAAEIICESSLRRRTFNDASVKESTIENLFKTPGKTRNKQNIVPPAEESINSLESIPKTNDETGYNKTISGDNTPSESNLRLENMFTTPTQEPAERSIQTSSAKVMQTRAVTRRSSIHTVAGNVSSTSDISLGNMFTTPARTTHKKASVIPKETANTPLVEVMETKSMTRRSSLRTPVASLRNRREYFHTSTPNKEQFEIPYNINKCDSTQKLESETSKIIKSPNPMIPVDEYFVEKNVPEDKFEQNLGLPVGTVESESGTDMRNIMSESIKISDLHVNDAHNNDSPSKNMTDAYEAYGDIGNLVPKCTIFAETEENGSHALKDDSRINHSQQEVSGSSAVTEFKAPHDNIKPSEISLYEQNSTFQKMYNEEGPTCRTTMIQTSHQQEDVCNNKTAASFVESPRSPTERVTRKSILHTPCDVSLSRKTDDKSHESSSSPQARMTRKSVLLTDSDKCIQSESLVSPQPQRTTRKSMLHTPVGTNNLSINPIAVDIVGSKVRESLVKTPSSSQLLVSPQGRVTRKSTLRTPVDNVKIKVRESMITTPNTSQNSGSKGSPRDESKLIDSDKTLGNIPAHQVHESLISPQGTMKRDSILCTPSQTDLSTNTNDTNKISKDILDSSAHKSLIKTPCTSHSRLTRTSVLRTPCDINLSTNAIDSDKVSVDFMDSKSNLTTKFDDSDAISNNHESLISPEGRKTRISTRRTPCDINLSTQSINFNQISVDISDSQINESLLKTPSSYQERDTPILPHASDESNPATKLTFSGNISSDHVGNQTNEPLIGPERNLTRNSILRTPCDANLSTNRQEIDNISLDFSNKKSRESFVGTPGSFEGRVKSIMSTPCDNNLSRKEIYLNNVAHESFISTSSSPYERVLDSETNSSNVGQTNGSIVSCQAGMTRKSILHTPCDNNLSTKAIESDKLLVDTVTNISHETLVTTPSTSKPRESLVKSPSSPQRRVTRNSILHATCNESNLTTKSNDSCAISTSVVYNETHESEVIPQGSVTRLSILRTPCDTNLSTNSVDSDNLSLDIPNKTSDESLVGTPGRLHGRITRKSIVNTPYDINLSTKAIDSDKLVDSEDNVVDESLIRTPSSPHERMTRKPIPHAVFDDAVIPEDSMNSEAISGNVDHINKSIAVTNIFHESLVATPGTNKPYESLVKTPSSPQVRVTRKSMLRTPCNVNISTKSVDSDSMSLDILNKKSRESLIGTPGGLCGRVTRKSNVITPCDINLPAKVIDSDKLLVDLEEDITHESLNRISSSPHERVTRKSMLPAGCDASIITIGSMDSEAISGNVDQTNESVASSSEVGMTRKSILRTPCGINLSTQSTESNKLLVDTVANISHESLVATPGDSKPYESLVKTPSSPQGRVTRKSMLRTPCNVNISTKSVDSDSMSLDILNKKSRESLIGTPGGLYGRVTRKSNVITPCDINLPAKVIDSDKLLVDLEEDITHESLNRIRISSSPHERVTRKSMLPAGCDASITTIGSMDSEAISGNVDQTNESVASSSEVGMTRKSILRTPCGINLSTQSTESNKLLVDTVANISHESLVATPGDSKPYESLVKTPSSPQLRVTRKSTLHNEPNLATKYMDPCELSTSVVYSETRECVVSPQGRATRLSILRTPCDINLSTNSVDSNSLSMDIPNKKSHESLVGTPGSLHGRITRKSIVNTPCDINLSTKIIDSDKLVESDDNIADKSEIRTPSSPRGKVTRKSILHAVFEDSVITTDSMDSEVISGNADHINELIDSSQAGMTCKSILRTPCGSKLSTQSIESDKLSAVAVTNRSQDALETTPGSNKSREFLVSTPSSPQARVTRKSILRTPCDVNLSTKSVDSVNILNILNKKSHESFVATPGGIHGRVTRKSTAHTPCDISVSTKVIDSDKLLADSDDNIADESLIRTPSSPREKVTRNSIQHAVCDDSYIATETMDSEAIPDIAIMGQTNESIVSSQPGMTPKSILGTPGDNGLSTEWIESDKLSVDTAASISHTSLVITPRESLVRTPSDPQGRVTRKSILHTPGEESTTKSIVSDAVTKQNVDSKTRQSFISPQERKTRKSMLRTPCDINISTKSIDSNIDKPYETPNNPQETVTRNSMQHAPSDELIRTPICQLNYYNRPNGGKVDTADIQPIVPFVIEETPAKNTTAIHSHETTPNPQKSEILSTKSPVAAAAQITDSSLISDSSCHGQINNVTLLEQTPADDNESTEVQVISSAEIISNMPNPGIVQSPTVCPDFLNYLSKRVATLEQAVQSIECSESVRTPVQPKRKLYTKTDPEDRTPDNFRVEEVRSVSNNEYLSLINSPPSITENKAEETSESNSSLGKTRSKRHNVQTNKENLSESDQEIVMRRKVMFDERIQIKEINSPDVVGDIITKVALRKTGRKGQKQIKVVVSENMNDNIKPATRRRGAQVDDLQNNHDDVQILMDTTGRSKRPERAARKKVLSYNEDVENQELLNKRVVKTASPESKTSNHDVKSIEIREDDASGPIYGRMVDPPANAEHSSEDAQILTVTTEKTNSRPRRAASKKVLRKNQDLEEDEEQLSKRVDMVSAESKYETGNDVKCTEITAPGELISSESVTINTETLEYLADAELSSEIVPQPKPKGGRGRNNTLSKSIHKKIAESSAVVNQAADEIITSKTVITRTTRRQNQRKVIHAVETQEQILTDASTEPTHDGSNAHDIKESSKRDDSAGLHSLNHQETVVTDAQQVKNNLPLDTQEGLLPGISDSTEDAAMPVKRSRRGVTRKNKKEDEAVALASNQKHTIEIEEAVCKTTEFEKVSKNESRHAKQNPLNKIIIEKNDTQPEHEDAPIKKTRRGVAIKKTEADANDIASNQEKAIGEEQVMSRSIESIEVPESKGRAVKKNPKVIAEKNNESSKDIVMPAKRSRRVVSKKNTEEDETGTTSEQIEDENVSKSSEPVVAPKSKGRGAKKNAVNKVIPEENHTSLTESTENVPIPVRATRRGLSKKNRTEDNSDTMSNQKHTKTEDEKPPLKTTDSNEPSKDSISEDTVEIPSKPKGRGTKKDPLNKVITEDNHTSLLEQDVALPVKRSRRAVAKKNKQEDNNLSTRSQKHPAVEDEAPNRTEGVEGKTHYELREKDVSGQSEHASKVKEVSLAKRGTTRSRRLIQPKEDVSNTEPTTRRKPTVVSKHESTEDEVLIDSKTGISHKTHSKRAPRIVEKAVADSTIQDISDTVPNKESRKRTAHKEVVENDPEVLDEKIIPSPADIVIPGKRSRRVGGKTLAVSDSSKQKRANTVKLLQQNEIHSTVEESLNESHMIKTILPSSHTSTPLTINRLDQEPLKRGRNRLATKPKVALSAKEQPISDVELETPATPVAKRARTVKQKVNIELTENKVDSMEQSSGRRVLRSRK